MNKLDHAFNQLKNTEDLYLTIYSHQKGIQQLMSAFLLKMETFISLKNVKNMGSFMSNLKMMSNKGRNENSKREMLRVNSRMDREYDDF